MRLRESDGDVSNDKEQIMAKKHEGDQDEPVLDGAEETFEGDEDPRKGDDDPALIRNLETHEPTTNPYG